MCQKKPSGGHFKRIIIAQLFAVVLIPILLVLNYFEKNHRFSTKIGVENGFITIKYEGVKNRFLRLGLSKGEKLNH